VKSRSKSINHTSIAVFNPTEPDPSRLLAELSSAAAPSPPPQPPRAPPKPPRAPPQPSRAPPQPSHAVAVPRAATTLPRSHAAAVLPRSRAAGALPCEPASPPRARPSSPVAVVVPPTVTPYDLTLTIVTSSTFSGRSLAKDFHTSSTLQALVRRFRGTLAHQGHFPFIGVSLIRGSYCDLFFSYLVCLLP
jgi:hypothetical protein